MRRNLLIFPLLILSVMTVSRNFKILWLLLLLLFLMRWGLFSGFKYLLTKYPHTHTHTPLIQHINLSTKEHIDIKCCHFHHNSTTHCELKHKIFFPTIFHNTEKKCRSALLLICSAIQ